MYSLGRVKNYKGIPTIPKPFDIMDNRPRSAFGAKEEAILDVEVSLMPHNRLVNITLYRGDSIQDKVKHLG